MAASISRRRLARHIADQLAAGADQAKVMHELAAYLIDQRREGQAALLVRDIEAIMASDHGHVVAHVVSARELSSSLVTAITAFVATQTNAQAVEVKSSVDPSLLGGVIIKTPSAELDTSVLGKLNALRA